MSYARNLLSRGEEVVFESRQHWLAILGQTWLFVIGAILVLAVLIWATSSDLGSIEGGVQVVSLVAADRLAGLHGPQDLVLAQPGVPDHDPPRDQGGGHLQQADGRLKPGEGERRPPDPELAGPHLRLRQPRHHDRLRNGRGRHGQRLPDAGRAGEVQGRDAEPEGAPGVPGPGAASRPAAGTRRPSMQRAEPMAPRAGSSQVSEVRTDAASAPSPAPVPPAAPAVAAAAGGGSSDVAARLESLAGLRDKGLITPEEYEAKKRELLERL